MIRIVIIVAFGTREKSAMSWNVCRDKMKSGCVLFSNNWFQTEDSIVPVHICTYALFFFPLGKRFILSSLDCLTSPLARPLRYFDSVQRNPACWRTAALFLHKIALETPIWICRNWKLLIFLKIKKIRRPNISFEVCDMLKSPLGKREI